MDKPDRRSILEALLFVGNEENRPLSAQEAAAAVGGVSPREIQAYVEELNAAYDSEGAAYTIIREGGGFRMALCEPFERVRHRFYARIREARLSRAAVEVLAIVAYRQPIRSEDVDGLRGAKSGAILAQLVRRRLLAIDRPADTPRRPFYRTTDRFLHLYGLTSLEDLPSSDRFSRDAEGPDDAHGASATP
jgi:segregation and condensation protein B